MKQSAINNQERLRQLATGKLSRLLWDYSLPAVVGMVVMSLYNIIDRIFIGQGVGPDAIAGLAITFPVANISTALGVLIGAGAAARTSILLGAKDVGGACHVLGNALVLTVINSAIYISAFAFFLEDILRAFGASDVTLPYAYDFVLYLLPGMFVTNVSFSFNNVMRASGYPVKAMYTMLIGAGLNLLLAPLFIFGFGLGIKGAAIATDIAMTVSAAFVMWHFMRPTSTVKFTPGTYRLKLHIVMSIISIGAAPALVNVASCFVNVIINRSLYEYGGDCAVGAAGIFSSFASLMIMVVLGICQGMQPIIGYNYGAGHNERLKGVFMLAVMWSTVVCVLGTVTSVLWPDVISRAFTTDSQLIAVTDNALRITMRCFFVAGLQVVCANFFQSIGKSGRAIFLSLSRQVIFLIPMLLVLPGIWGLDGIWLSFPYADVCSTVVSVVMVWYQFRLLVSQPSQDESCRYSTKTTI